MTRTRLIQALQRAWVIAALASLTACVVAPVPPVAPVAPHFVAEGVVIEPPALRTEVIGVAPAPGHFWTGGYWDWVDGRHVWVGGRWQAHRPGYYWEPHAWVRVGAGWNLRGGYWARR